MGCRRVPAAAGENDALHDGFLTWQVARHRARYGDNGIVLVADLVHRIAFAVAGV